jgi:hypothetical protein
LAGARWYECDRRATRAIAERILKEAGVGCSSSEKVQELNNGRETVASSDADEYGGLGQVTVPCDSEWHEIAWGAELIMKSEGNPKDLMDKPCIPWLPRQRVYNNRATDWDMGKTYRKGPESARDFIRRRVEARIMRYDKDLWWRLNEFTRSNAPRSTGPLSPYQELQVRRHSPGLPKRSNEGEAPRSMPSQVPMITCEAQGGLCGTAAADMPCQLIIDDIGQNKDPDVTDTTLPLGIDLATREPTNNVEFGRKQHGWALAVCITIRAMCKPALGEDGDCDGGGDTGDKKSRNVAPMGIHPVSAVFAETLAAAAAAQRLFSGGSTSCGGSDCACSECEDGRDVFNQFSIDARATAGAIDWAIAASNGQGSFWEASATYGELARNQRPSQLTDRMMEALADGA